MMGESAKILGDYGLELDEKIESLSRAVTKTAGWDYLPPEVKAKWRVIDENLTDFLKGIQNEVERLKVKRPSASRSFAEKHTPTICPVCGDSVAGGSEEYLNHIKTKHPEEWLKLKTDPSYSLGGAVPIAVAGILKCRWCGAPYAYKENLELHEKTCPMRK